MLVKINDSLPPPHDIEARAKAFDEIYVLLVSIIFLIFIFAKKGFEV